MGYRSGGKSGKKTVMRAKIRVIRPEHVVNVTLMDDAISGPQVSRTKVVPPDHSAKLPSPTPIKLWDLGSVH